MGHRRNGQHGQMRDSTIRCNTSLPLHTGLCGISACSAISRRWAFSAVAAGRLNGWQYIAYAVVGSAFLHHVYGQPSPRESSQMRRRDAEMDWRPIGYARRTLPNLSLIHISEPTRLALI
eukprot:482661-Alexandrium_andersonii.AAC.1